MKRFYNIGEVSNICNVPVSTLRYYDEVGIIHPIKTDASTKYRYYADEQLSIIDTVTYLRSLDFSIKDIKSYMGSRNEMALLDVLQQKIDEYESQIKELQDKLGKADFISHQLLTILIGPSFGEVYTKQWPVRKVRAIKVDDVTNENTEYFNYTVREIHNEIFTGETVFNDQIGLIHSLKEYKETSVVKYDYIFLEVTKRGNADFLKNMEIPAGTYLEIRYRWSPENCKEAHNKMIEYIENNHIEVDDEIIELPIITGQPEVTGGNHVMALECRIAGT